MPVKLKRRFGYFCIKNGLVLFEKKQESLYDGIDFLGMKIDGSVRSHKI